MVSDPFGDTVDYYGRIIRYVYTSDYVQSINYELVKDGYATAYTKYPFHLGDYFTEAENYAIDNNLGLWNSCDNPTPTTIPQKLPTAIPQSINTPQPTSISSSPRICSYNAYDCGNFSSWTEANNIYQYCINNGYGDIHRLDRDNNGYPCESL